MPHPRVRHARQGVPLGHLGEVQAGAEVVALGVQHDRADLGGQVGEDALQAEDGAVGQGVPLGGAAQGDDADGTLTTQRQGLWELATVVHDTGTHGLSPFVAEWQVS